MDLNDLRYFALTVEHGSFSAAARFTHLNKSKLSRRVARLEEQLGVRLLQRSTRRLVLTEAGRAFYEHCSAMVIEANAARDAVARLRSEPSGIVRMTCPVMMAQFFVAQLMSMFMAQYAKVRIELEATDRVVTLIDEGVDIALGFRETTEQPGLVVRKLASNRMVLVASTQYAHSRGQPRTPQDVAGHDTIGDRRDGQVQQWTLVDDGGREASITHSPRLLCSDFAVQYHAATHGIGIALLPHRIAAPAIAARSLVRIAPQWSTVPNNIYAAIANRRGMLPSVRAVLDHLATHLPEALSV